MMQIPLIPPYRSSRLDRNIENKKQAVMSPSRSAKVRWLYACRQLRLSFAPHDMNFTPAGPQLLSCSPNIRRCADGDGSDVLGGSSPACYCGRYASVVQFNALIESDQ